MTKQEATRAWTSVAHVVTDTHELTMARVIMVSLIFAVSLLVCYESRAQSHDNRSHDAPAHTHIDNRFSHNQYYYDRGYTLRGAPRGGYDIHQGGHNYWYDSGQWYHRNGGVSVVIGAPIGAFVPILPPYYSTVWWAGAPYYYANDSYYIWSGDRDKYEVVEPPAGIETSGTTQAPGSDTIFVYPKNGQSTEQQSRDRYECHRSAVEQTGFDPTAAGGGVPRESAATKRSDYFRAQAACLDARGYSVK